MTEVAGGLVDAPQFVGAGDELAFLVPAFDPCDAVVKAEEACLVPSAAGALDLAVLLAHLVVGSEEVPLED